jgi:hypothetical protein
MWPFARPKPSEPAPAPAAFAAQPPVITVGDQPAPPDALEYRFGAIWRDREQRNAEGRPRHPEHDRMSGEAMQLAGTLVQAGRWTQAQADERLARLREIG